MEGRRCQAVGDENAETTAPADRPAGGSSDLRQRMSSSTKSDSEPMLTNVSQESHQNATARDGGLLPNEHAPASPSHSSSNLDFSPSSMSQATQSSQDSAGLHTADAAATVAVRPYNIRAILKKLRQFIRRPIAYLSASLAGRGSVENGRLSGAGPSQSLPKVVMRNESTEVTMTTTGTALYECSTAVEHEPSSETTEVPMTTTGTALSQCSTAVEHEPSSETTDSPFNGTEEEERERPVDVGGSCDVLGGQLARQQAEVGPTQIAGNSRAGTAAETLVRLTALQRLRVLQRGEAAIQVHAPRDLDVWACSACNFDFHPARADIAATTGFAEDAHHLAEWDTLTRAVLSAHRCICRLLLQVSATVHPSGYFYRSFSLEEGTASIGIQVSEFEDPYTDFVQPCLRYFCRLLNAPQTAMSFQHSSISGPNVAPNELYAALPELNDKRIQPVNPK
ncbi:uncharacterized protein LOC119396878 [Rhipicephalus sanguineus]|uniref:uncharacterized protein LOC119396878 n=1 Tax=Rhipicephalus sanguineus TaxID=34632 RepID=UPI0020C30755|nr:uncharacterized protein LOC119396878 [Rhipicephalus sanguineus]